MTPLPNAARTASSRVDAAKARLLRGIVTRKQADYAIVDARGKDVMAFIRKNARADLLQTEAAVFAKFDLDARIDDVLAVFHRDE